MNKAKCEYYDRECKHWIEIKNECYFDWGCVYISGEEPEYMDKLNGAEYMTKLDNEKEMNK